MKTKSHSFVFNPETNSGEQFAIHTLCCKEDENETPFLNHELVLNSYGNRVVIHLTDGISPSQLRQLANELDEILAKI